MAKKPKYTKIPKKLYVHINEWMELDVSTRRADRGYAIYSGEAEVVYVLEKVVKQVALNSDVDNF